MVFPTESTQPRKGHHLWMAPRIAHLIVVDLDLPEDVVLDEALEDGAVDLAEELARVHRVLRDHHEPVVVHHVALQVVRVARVPVDDETCRITGTD